MSVLSQSQDASSNLPGHRSESSSSRSISSTPSPRNWYHRTLDRFIPQPSPRQQSAGGVQGATSIKKLSEKTSHSLLNTSINYRHVFSKQQGTLGQHNASLVQLPGTPGGQTCRPLSLIVHERTISSLDLLTPDQSGLSSDSGGPVTPRATESIYSLPFLTKDLRDHVMGHAESKLASSKVGKIIRKPVSGLLRRKKSQQTVVNEDTSTPPLTPEPVLDPASDPQPRPEPASLPTPVAEPESEPAATQPKELVKVDSNSTGLPQDLRHRASSGKLKVPRRRSSLTAIHLDRSHFEKPLNSKPSGSSNRGDRATSFSESFQPVVYSSGASTAVPSPNPQEDDRPSDPRPPDLLSLPPSNRRPSDAGLSTSQTGPVHIRFPVTWPGGDPILEPAPLMRQHYKCSRSHKLMIRERAMFNQIPCMTCGVDDKKARFTCQWCELRVCDSCMRQLASNPGRPLEPVLEWVADKVKAYLARGPATFLKTWVSKETIKLQKSVETLPGIDTGRSGSIAPSVDTVKEAKREHQPESQKDQMKDTSAADHNAGEGNDSPVEHIKSAQSAREGE